ncbi:hypothetical protein OGAPHI_006796 [Ogataea philodendri]|uniref:Uncharacterized protein n=1 Tax=Ogataea philodendri TaxID=1378263 RepID=A0A9P8NXR9_9ASCO|nr:uncharacterized protein OGAPHI_006796 [Ogataea philodendri]KAH3661389.1 hypothetical protein OGAPHI_006796 [Ogataea philodendri]
MWTKKEAMDLEIAPERNIPIPPASSQEMCTGSTRSLNDFLRISRTLIDDKLRTRLNSILNHHETQSRGSILPRSESCQQFVDELLLPQWRARTSRIQFCLNHASELVKEVETKEVQLDEEERNRLTRVDPYALKDLTRDLREKREVAEQIRNRYQNELEIEEIIEGRSKSLIKDLCGENILFSKQ